MDIYPHLWKINSTTLIPKSEETCNVIRFPASSLVMATVLASAANNRVATEERNIRVEDYLNDKLQTAVDIANIDTLLDDVRAQQALLQQQVRLYCVRFWHSHR